MNRLFASLALVALTAACSSGSSSGAAPAPEPEPFNPAGVYDITFDIQGESMTGTMELNGTPDMLSGSIASDMGTVEMINIVFNGNQMTWDAETPQGSVSFSITFEENGFSGEWSMEGFGGGMSGTKRAS